MGVCLWSLGPVVVRPPSTGSYGGCSVRSSSSPSFSLGLLRLRSSSTWSSSSSSSAAAVRGDAPEPLPKREVAVVVVPGWLSDCSQYEPMASHLRSKGLHTLIVPLKWYNWIPSLGGRSVRPILDRIDASISSVLDKSLEVESDLLKSYEKIQGEPTTGDYTFWDFLKEFLNPKNGAQGRQLQLRSAKEPSLPSTSFRKVILVAHSAGGWICRILLGGKVPYDGRTYSAASNVKALVTLGTPHKCTDKLTKRNMDFVNENYPGTAELGVDYICVAGKFIQGESQLSGWWKDFAWQSYELCCGRGDVWGDGVIPLECAIGLEGAQQIILEGVEHFPSSQDRQIRSWYGSPDVVDKWLPSLSQIVSLEAEAAARAG